MSIIVAIDGPSGVGKSTTSRLVARALHLPHIDTGAMYRAIALKALRADLNAESPEEVAQIAAATRIEFTMNEGEVRVILDGEDVSDSIREPEISMAASNVSAIPAVRRVLVALQQELGRTRGGVLEGRDIGTRVFPETPHKFFLTATPEVRARRRWQEMLALGKSTPIDSVLEDLRRRDHQDTTRSDSPLAYDQTYQVLDTTSMTIEQVVDAIVQSVKRDEELQS